MKILKKCNFLESRRSEASPRKYYMVLIAAAFLAMLVQPAYAGWYDTAWVNRRQINITTGNASLPANYTVELVMNVTGSDFLDSGNDIRIVYWNGATNAELDRINYSTQWNTTATKIHFKVPFNISSSSSNDSLYVYYNNSNAASPPANGSLVYLLYDDFEDGIISGQLSVVTAGTGVSVTEIKGKLNVSGTTNAGNQFDTFGINTNSSFNGINNSFLFGPNIYVESAFSIIRSTSGIQQNWKASFGFSSGIMINSESSTNKRVQYYSGGWIDIADSGLDATTFASQNVSQRKLGNGTAHHLENGILKATRTGLATSAVNLSFTFGPDVTNGAGPFDVSYDNIMVRKYVTPEPTTSLWAEETAPQPAAWYNTDWLYRKNITFNSTLIAWNNLTDFPALINISDSNLSGFANPDGSDILFTNSDGTTKLDHEIENYTAGNLVAWVRIPNLYNTTNQTIFMYYGFSETASQQNRTGVWNASYVGVWHLGEGTGVRANDSTSRNNNGTLTNGPTWNTTGQADGSMDFDGVDDYVTVTNEESYLVNDFDSVQGRKQWSYQRFSGSTYTNLTYCASCPNDWTADGNSQQPSNEWMGMLKNDAHPGSTTYGDVVATWKSIRAGSIRVTAVIADSNCGGGDGVRLIIEKNTTALSDTSYNNCFTSTNITTTTTVGINDYIRFRINRRGDNGYDSTSHKFYVRYTDMASNSTIGIGNESKYSASLWVNPNAVTKGTTVFTDNYMIQLQIDKGIPKILFNNTIGPAGNITAHTILANTWTYLALTYNGTNLSLYINGTLINSTSKSGLLTHFTGLRIGGKYTTLTDTFGGRIDEVHLHNGTLSADWIRTEYNNQFEPFTFHSVGSQEVSGAGNTCTPPSNTNWTINAPDKCVIVGQSIKVTNIFIQGSSGTVIFRHSNITSTDCRIQPNAGAEIMLTVEPTVNWGNGC